jgi:hypothetical protein
MMIEEEPAIQVLVSEFLLNCGQVHRAIISQWGGSIACRAASVRSRPAYRRHEQNRHASPLTFPVEYFILMGYD